ncbi:MAG: RNA polymerase sigma factor SigZ [Saprospiraceae bacterium]|nr:RNA polymerase sigma factor SigZ [Saprospiraceae bacterium]
MSALTGELYNQFHSELEIFIIKKVKDKVVAQDILHDVFIKIHLHLNTVRDHTKLNGWIYQLTRNTINDYYRKLVVSEEATEISNGENESDINSQFGLEKCLMPFIDRLPKKYKEALILTEINGLSQTQFAKHLNISYSAAKSRVQRARIKLKSIFTNCCQIQADSYGNILSYRQIDCGSQRCE